MPPTCSFSGCGVTFFLVLYEFSPALRKNLRSVVWNVRSEQRNGGSEQRNVRSVVRNETFSRANIQLRAYIFQLPYCNLGSKVTLPCTFNRFNCCSVKFIVQNIFWGDIILLPIFAEENNESKNIPTIFFFFGLRFFFFTNEHLPPHILVRSADSKAKFNLLDGTMMEESSPHGQNLLLTDF